MQKVSKDKQVEKKLREEIGSDFKEALKKSILSEDEGAAAEKFLAKSIKNELKQTARAEILKECEYPAPIGGSSEVKRRYERLIKSLDEVEKELKSLLGNKFIALQLHGSYAKGYPSEKSDVDITLLAATTINFKEAEKAKKIISEAVGKATKSRVHLNLYTLERAIAAIQTNDMVAVECIYPFFVGKHFGERIHNSRKEIVQELEKSPFGKGIWDHVRLWHRKDIVPLVLAQYLTINELEARILKLGVSREDIPEILRAREEFELPTFEEMKRRYGVA